MNDRSRSARLYLCPAIEKGDLALVEKLLNEGANPNDDGYSDSETPLTTALRNSQNEIAALLIARGASVSFRKSYPPLFLARSEKALKLLLDHGAHVRLDEKDHWGNTLLSAFASTAEPEAVKLLVARGTDAKSHPPQELLDGALVNAVACDNAPVVELLLEHGAKFNSAIWENVTTAEMGLLLIGAGATVNVALKGWLPLHRGVDAALEEGWTPLHLAARKHRADVAKILLRHGADISATTEDGLNALHVAASTSNEGRPDPKMLMLLIENGIDVNLKDNHGYTAFSHAVRLGGCASNIEVLLAHGAKLNCKYWEGDTALHWAATSGRVDVIEMCIKQGVSVNLQDKRGYTPLHCAAARNNARAVELLLDHRANPRTKDRHGQTPRQILLDLLSSNDPPQLGDPAVVVRLLENAEKRGWQFWK